MPKISKSSLAIILSRLKPFESPKVRIEQYGTDSEIAAEILTQAALQGDIKDRTIADFGSGSGILGLGAALLGAKKVYSVESESSAVALSKMNRAMLIEAYPELIREQNIEILEQDISLFSKKVDSIIQNPPFGTKKVHQDTMFLTKALDTAKVIYSFHKESTRSFLEKFVKKKSGRITHAWSFDFPLKKTMKFHHKARKWIKVVVLRIERII